ncbi:AGAL-like protein [Mya arenaria]|uniref:Alpha-galactosidase n=2 Tax=Mya arenaria TaxID=6604 RepID=A0ABY7DN57_MYAAR|nr:alpha-N-acetylgalactosaminidase-like isoform X2 [Mya arenaria]XP_052794244.1 alpha-N-acetylgalactosaminidase-like isoform X2 [Mya arenaria]XP_052794245.1 alpha-N-acetylgalactosaminidase-like isoform X2 [Mya arenaria]XP_052794246.1 alpha-N-acetylgalactosaminidase-like isoform X2 [Mya arenaria]WAQ98162.1 AGAL-like protein [Mya arenaria]
MKNVLLLLLVQLTRDISGLDNGLALTPPMGWLTWERFRCNTDCVNRPDDCISETLIKVMADHLAADGYLAAGYQYIIIDDCWLAPDRDAHGRLQPDPVRFPSGIAALVEYVHEQGLKFGIYEDFGVRTCAGFPGSEFYMETDAQTFAEWGVDYVKFDGCNSNPQDMDLGYEAFGLFLNKTGRPMVYSCEWPMYQQFAGFKPDYAAIQRTCNMWRVHGDISDSWTSVSSIISYYGKDYNNMSLYAKPGAWNDPDMLVVGNFGLSYEQARVQMAMWAIMAAPMLMSTDLRSITAQDHLLLTNLNVIAINQDPLGIQGRRILQINGTNVEVWSRPISPVGSFAIAFLQLANHGDPTPVSVTGRDIGLTASGYMFMDGFNNQPMGTYGPDSPVKVVVNPNGVVLFRAKPI